MNFWTKSLCSQIFDLKSPNFNFFAFRQLSVVLDGQDGLKVTSIDLWDLICHSCLGWHPVRLGTRPVILLAWAISKWLWRAHVTFFGALWTVFEREMLNSELVSISYGFLSSWWKHMIPLELRCTALMRVCSLLLQELWEVYTDHCCLESSPCNEW